MHLDAPLKNASSGTAQHEGVELLERCWLIRKQKQTCRWIFVDLNRSVMYTIINPMWVNVKGLGNLRNRECPFNPPGMGLRAYLKLPMFESNAFDRAGQNDQAHGRAIAQLG